MDLSFVFYLFIAISMFTMLHLRNKKQHNTTLKTYKSKEKQSTKYKYKNLVWYFQNKMLWYGMVWYFQTKKTGYLI